MVSHFLQLTSSPVPIAQSEFDVSWVALGLVSSVFYCVSGMMQTVSGVFVDRLGARRVLLTGMTLFAGAIAAAGSRRRTGCCCPSRGRGRRQQCLPSADYSMLNASVSARASPAATARTRFSEARASSSARCSSAPSVTSRVAHGAPGRRRRRVRRTLVIATQTRGLGVSAPRPSRSRVKEYGRHPPAARGAHPHGAELLRNAQSVDQRYPDVRGAALGMIYDTPLALATGALTIYLIGGAIGTSQAAFLPIARAVTISSPRQVSSARRRSSDPGER